VSDSSETRALAAILDDRREARTRPPLSAIWHALAGLPDPEVPVISIVELGILRGVEWDRDDPSTLVVVVTPTYAGCPATEMIGNAIREALAAIGAPRVRLETRLSPAWTTDWIAPEGRRKLRDFGIAPPDGVRTTAATIDVSGVSPLRRARVSVVCPRCGSAATQLVSQFGSTACKAQYRCLDCLEPFDYFKPH
jgi:ring-1,2-phenylacetyl-CoA epoxidase subunit PaaD